MNTEMPNKEIFKHQVALITGATRGIGRAIAEQLARGGANLILTARNAKSLEETAEQLKSSYACEAQTIPAEFQSLHDLESLTRTIKKTHKSLDILINNAGITFSGTVQNTPTEAWDQCLAVNARAPFILCRELLPLLRRSSQGRIVNISSVVGIKGYAQQSAYSASKHALRGFSIALAEELAPEGIRVHVICPGAVATDMVAEVRPDIPKAALIQPEEIAKSVIFLLTQHENAIIDEIRIRRAASNPWFC